MNTLCDKKQTLSFDASGNKQPLCNTGVIACFKEKYLLVLSAQSVRPSANSEDLTIDNLSYLDPIICGLFNEIFSLQ